MAMTSRDDKDLLPSGGTWHDAIAYVVSSLQCKSGLEDVSSDEETTQDISTPIAIVKQRSVLHTRIRHEIVTPSTEPNVIVPRGTTVIDFQRQNAARRQPPSWISFEGSDLLSPPSRDRTPEASTGFEVRDLFPEEPGVIVPIPNLNESGTEDDSLTTMTDVDPPPAFVSSNGKRKSHYKTSPFSVFRKQGMYEDVLLREGISKDALARRAQIRETK
jgi:hypothetical protein